VSTETGQAQVDYLAERNVVVAVDLGGHGESGLGRADWNLAAFGDDVLAVVEEVGAQKVALVGHSMGGDAIVHAARQLGDRVAGLVWIDAFRSLGNEPESTPEQIEAFLAPFRADFAAAVAALTYITAPIVAINPDIQPTDVESMRRHGVEPVVLTNVGHFLMIEDPEQFNPILAGTLASFGG